MVANTIADRLVAAGVEVGQASLGQLGTYMSLLAKWNRHINLTALAVDPPSNEAIDRLIVEPVLAARFLENTSARIVDIGSGGGSPAIPFRIMHHEAGLTMIESRSKKCAFLREAVRTIGLDRTNVEETRFEAALQRPDLRSVADAITVRAVRIDEELVRLVRWLSKPGAQLIRFASASDGPQAPEFPGLKLVHEQPLLASTSSSIQLFHVEH